MKWSLCSEKFETFEIWAMFTLEGPHIVMSRTDAQNGLDFHFKQGKGLERASEKSLEIVICCCCSRRIN